MNPANLLFTCHHFVSGCMYNGIPMVMRDKFSASSYWKDCVKYRVTAAQYIGEVCR